MHACLCLPDSTLLSGLRNIANDCKEEFGPISSMMLLSTATCMNGLRMDTYKHIGSKQHSPALQVDLLLVNHQQSRLQEEHDRKQS